MDNICPSLILTPCVAGGKSEINHLGIKTHASQPMSRIQEGKPVEEGFMGLILSMLVWCLINY